MKYNKFWMTITTVVVVIAFGIIASALDTNEEFVTSFQNADNIGIDRNLYPSIDYQQQFINRVKSISIPISGNRFPIYVNTDNSWIYSGLNSWTSGYYPILRWWIYNKTKSSADLVYAKDMTNLYNSMDSVNWDDQNQYQTSTPYIYGLKYVSPGSPEYINWKNKAFRHVNRLVDSQFNPTIGAFTTSSGSRDVIVDSMVTGNLLLVWAYKNSQSQSDKANYLNKLRSHANVIIRDHFKSDNSGAVWQSVHYKSDGTVDFKHNHQTEGSSSNLVWARGQAWFMYGTAELYEFAIYLNDDALKTKYSSAFDKAANFWINGLNTYSDNGVMKNTIGMTTGRYDTSGTGIATSSLFKMYKLTGNTRYLNAARKSFSRLISPGYFSNGKLLHGFYAPWVAQDTELIWGDYYLSEIFERSVTNISNPNSITVASPNGGETWSRGTTKQITWNYVGSPGSYVKIELYKGGIFNKIISSSAPNDGSYSWIIPSLQTLGNDYKIKITSTSNSVYTDSSNNNFMISGPYITVVSPNGGENWVRGSTKTIIWKKDGNVGSYVKVELFKGGILNRVISSSTPNDDAYIWIIPSTQILGSDYNIKITSTNNSIYNDWGNNNFRISSDRLNPGNSLLVGGSIISQDGRFTLIMQEDGNLVLYRLSNGQALWSSGTYGQTVSQAVMQTDGNFVIYRTNGVPIWYTGTYGHPGAWLVIQNDGNVVIYSPTNSPLWSTNTGGN